MLKVLAANLVAWRGLPVTRLSRRAAFLVTQGHIRDRIRSFGGERYSFFSYSPLRAEVCRFDLDLVMAYSSVL